jgi:hypothetical protein
MPVKSWLAGVSALAALGLAANASANPNLVQNGGFENLSSGAANEWYAGLSNGFNPGAVLADWSLSAGGSGIVFGPGGADTTGAVLDPGINAGLWGPNSGSANGLPATSPAGGNYFADDDPVGFHATLSQSITGLTVGDRYRLGFYWAAGQIWEPAVGGWNGPTQNQLAVSLGTETFSTPVLSIASHGFSGWLGQSFVFTATSSAEVLSFLFESPSSVGVPPAALLDGVSLAAVPEPATWAVMLIGIAGLGAVARRRRNAAAAAAVSGP